MAKAILPTKKRRLAGEGGIADPAWYEYFENVTANLAVAVRATELGLSFPVSLTLTGVAATRSITVSAHTRRYPSGDKSVTAGTVLSGLTYGGTFYVYYDQAGRSGGTVTFAATATLADAWASPTNSDRHYVGRITMPANAGASNTSGTPAYPPGYE